MHKTENTSVRARPDLERLYLDARILAFFRDQPAGYALVLSVDDDVQFSLITMEHEVYGIIDPMAIYREDNIARDDASKRSRALGEHAFYFCGRMAKHLFVEVPYKYSAVPRLL